MARVANRPGGAAEIAGHHGRAETNRGRMFVPVQVGLSLVLVMLASLLSVSVIKLRGEQTGSIWTT